MRKLLGAQVPNTPRPSAAPFIENIERIVKASKSRGLDISWTNIVSVAGKTATGCDFRESTIKRVADMTHLLVFIKFVGLLTDIDVSIFFQPVPDEQIEEWLDRYQDQLGTFKQKWELAYENT